MGGRHKSAGRGGRGGRGRGRGDGGRGRGRGGGARGGGPASDSKSHVGGGGRGGLYGPEDGDAEFVALRGGGGPKRKHRQMFGAYGPNAGGRRVRKPDHDSETSSDSVDEDDLPSGSEDDEDDDPNVDTARVMRVGGIEIRLDDRGEGRRGRANAESSNAPTTTTTTTTTTGMVDESTKPSRGPGAQPGRRRHRRLCATAWKETTVATRTKTRTRSFPPRTEPKTRSTPTKTRRGAAIGASARTCV